MKIYIKHTARQFLTGKDVGFKTRLGRVYIAAWLGLVVVLGYQYHQHADYLKALQSSRQFAADWASRAREAREESRDSSFAEQSYFQFKSWEDDLQKEVTRTANAPFNFYVYGLIAPIFIGLMLTWIFLGYSPHKKNRP
ncbi:MAG: hypothetical protein C0509_03355 [Acinetobacter sp.]|nr:hypothetical protein [Acinetobacter sp.]